MPEGPEIETTELQETIEELHEERREREEEARRSAWTRYIALTTAILAVFAAIGALQSGNLVNHALINQLRASDKWNEYQADRQKQHLYSTQAYALLDGGATPPSEAGHASKKPAGEHAAATAVPAATGGHAAGTTGKHEKHTGGGGETGAKKPKTEWKALSRSERLAQYISQYEHEGEKVNDLSAEAKKLEEESEEMFHLHHQFAESVALIQVAIALSAVAALTRIKSVWAVGLAAGGIGMYYFIMGFLH